MFFVMIEHKVAHYAKWKRAVNSLAKWRKASGEKCFYASRNSKSPNTVMVWCEWDTAARARKFMKSAELRQHMREVGVIGKPAVSFFNRMDVLTAK
jgi:heme-degrading monooxygenase HmoA